MLRAVARHLRVAREAVEDDTIRCALLLENAQDVRVCLAVMDHQGAIESLGDIDMPAKRLMLQCLLCRLARAVVVKARLADRADCRVGREFLDAPEGSIEAFSPLPRDDSRHVVGMQGDGGDDLRGCASRLHRPFRRCDIASHLDDAGDASLTCHGEGGIGCR